MATEEIINETANGLAGNILVQLGSLALWLQAIGALILLWIIFQIVNWIMNRKRLKRLDEFEKKINRIERKIDKILKKK
jgi:uncharacterized protein YggT (Ycf19 family)